MFYNNICAVHQARRIFLFVLVLRSQTSGKKGYRVVIIETGQSINQSMTQSINQSINQSIDVRRKNQGKLVFKQNKSAKGLRQRSQTLDHDRSPGESK